MKKNYSIKIPLKKNSYEVMVGTNIINKCKNKIFSTIKDAKKIFVVTDTKIKKLHLKKLTQIIPGKYTVKTLVIKPGEKMKDIKTINRIINILLKNQISRNDVIFGLGGGVIGDIAGFLASITLRGLKLIHFPTTLLAQVDSSIGGKTGVNSSYGKNLIGTFYQPNLVICDTIFLSTLPKRELIAGYAEVIKYGVIGDPSILNLLDELPKIDDEKNIYGDILNQIIQKSVSIKARVVAQDEKEKGLRAILNYGHTFCHAFEYVTGYGQLLHGEAVSIGMLCASRLAERVGRIDKTLTERQKQLLVALGLPTAVPDVDHDDIMAAMQRDKKVAHGKLRFVLPTQLGHVELVDDIKPEVAREILQQA